MIRLALPARDAGLWLVLKLPSDGPAKDLLRGQDDHQGHLMDGELVANPVRRGDVHLSASARAVVRPEG